MSYPGDQTIGNNHSREMELNVPEPQAESQAWACVESRDGRTEEAGVAGAEKLDNVGNGRLCLGNEVHRECEQTPQLKEVRVG